MTSPHKETESQAEVNGRAALRTFYRTSEKYLGGLVERGSDSFHAKYLRMVQEYVAAESHLLDLGCGTGYSSYRLSQIGYRVEGLDVSDKFLAAAPSRQGEYLHYCVGDAMELPFEDESFDAVSTFDMIEHVPDAEEALRQVDRVLKPGGRFVVVCPNYFSPVIPLKALINLLKGGPGYLSFYESIGAAIVGVGQTIAGTLSKKQSGSPDFRYRMPTLEGSIDADCDCVYLPSPVDFERYFARSGYRTVKYGGDDSSLLRRVFTKLVPSFTPTVYYVAEKPR